MSYLGERTTDAFKRGFRHGYAGTGGTPVHNPCTFAEYDYAEGHSAGRNERHWELVRAGLLCDIRSRRCGNGVRA